MPKTCVAFNAITDSTAECLHELFISVHSVLTTYAHSYVIATDMHWRHHSWKYISGNVRCLSESTFAQFRCLYGSFKCMLRIHRFIWLSAGVTKLSIHSTVQLDHWKLQSLTLFIVSIFNVFYWTIIKKIIWPLSVNEYRPCLSVRSRTTKSLCSGIHGVMSWAIGHIINTRNITPPLHTYHLIWRSFEVSPDVYWVTTVNMYWYAAMSNLTQENYTSKKYFWVPLCCFNKNRFTATFSPQAVAYNPWFHTFVFTNTFLVSS